MSRCDLCGRQVQEGKAYCEDCQERIDDAWGMSQS